MDEGKPKNYLFLILLVVFIAGGIWRRYFINSSPPPVTKVTQSFPTPQITIKPTIVTPIAAFKERITKKFFGTYITPTNSPIQPEKFTGFHTGVDVEYTDVTQDVPVYAIADGNVVFSGYASGYGGVMVIQHQINNQILYAIYGHLRQSTMLKINTSVIQGEKIAVLGTGYTSETDGERRHLHFGISKLNTLTGYATSLLALNNDWINPLSLY